MRDEKLPKGWKNCVVGDLFSFVGGGTPSKSNLNYWNGAVPWASIKDISRVDVIKSTIDSISEEGLANSASNLASKGDLIIGTRMSVGKVVITEIETAINQDLKILRSELPNKFSFYWFSHLRKELEELSSGTTVKGIRLENLRSLSFPLPPFPEQQRIVAKLDAIFGHLDVLREKLDRIPVLLKNFRQQVLTQAVTGKLTKEWRETNYVTLDFSIIEGKEIISVKKNLYNNQTANFLEKLEESLSLDLNGVFFSNDWCTIKPEFISSPEKYSIGIGPFGSNLKVSDYKTEGYPLIFVRNVIANKFDGLDPKFVDEEKFNELLPHTIKPGDLLITKMGTPPGDCKLYPENAKDGIITSDILKVRIWKKYFIPKFYEYVISSKIVRTQIEEITKGVAHQKISLKRFKDIDLPFPTRIEQEEIVKRVDSLFELADRIESQYQSLKAKIDQLPQAVLNKAFRGELVGQEVKEYVREAGEEMLAAEGVEGYNKLN
ncbi:hypothetical protein P872_20385 [Rhodonellum psychrophilum GCM71 = DSM 17998]|uniref:Type I restriction modification DNA specificity domain-containing protein n=2 Tax=Rhodonellum TaxID=336827 RepID=U5BZ55_9BACT|nr:MULTISPECIES: restriction endonuclease subunit S [Rhodonellum]ERM81197.1 hypothetical protein P872_20385 [Rhodonellum psychrophilum GCM71 = DSM 17998]SDZ23479.1 type I restriction enzyme, S subunit [Rhodonellum ikkaensis]